MYILGAILFVAGLIGCLLPILPGPPLAYASLLVIQFSSKVSFDVDFLVLWAVITLVVTILDYWVPIYGTRRLGGTRTGVRGATAGLLVGLFFFPPVGLIVGPFAGAFVGEMMAGQPSDRALRSAIGSFIGFLTGTLMKLVVTVMMGWHFVAAIF